MVIFLSLVGCSMRNLGIAGMLKRSFSTSSLTVETIQETEKVLVCLVEDILYFTFLLWTGEDDCKLSILTEEEMIEMDLPFSECSAGFKGIRDCASLVRIMSKATFNDLCHRYRDHVHRMKHEAMEKFKENVKFLAEKESYFIIALKNSVTVSNDVGKITITDGYKISEIRCWYAKVEERRLSLYSNEVDKEIYFGLLSKALRDLCPAMSKTDQERKENLLVSSEGHFKKGLLECYYSRITVYAFPDKIYIQTDDEVYSIEAINHPEIEEYLGFIAQQEMEPQDYCDLYVSEILNYQELEFLLKRGAEGRRKKAYREDREEESKEERVSESASLDIATKIPNILKLAIWMGIFGILMALVPYQS
jgi:hypothetical protein